MLSKDQLADAGEWASLNPALSSQTLIAVEGLGFKSLTPVQAAVIPLFLQNKDVVVEAVTGSGKTLAFMIPLLEILYKNYRNGQLGKQRIGAIVISPTRELADQINQVLKTFIAYLQTDDQLRITSFLVTGGRPVEEDIAEYRQLNSEILVATPGKLQRFLQSPHVNSKSCEVLVLDEADRLLDLGFQDTLQKILQQLPKQRRTGLFSATMTEGLRELVKAGLRNPVKVVVKVEDIKTGAIQRTPSTLHIFYHPVDADKKYEYLLRCLLTASGEKSIVYFNTCFCVDYFFRITNRLPISKQLPSLFSLHGKMVAKRRKLVFEKFSASPSGVLFCTDVAARGLDIPDVDFVIQFDPPQDPQAFSHRCGRTARQGRQGKALVLLQPHEDTFVEFMKNRKIPMERLKDRMELATGLPELPPLSKPMPEFYRPTTDSSDSIRQFIHSQLLADRSLYLLSIQAFVSFLKSYKEHQLSYIFPFSRLPLNQVIRGFYLLHVPRCPELKNIKRDQMGGNGGDFIDSRRDTDKIPFIEPDREKKRQAELVRRVAESGERNHQQIATSNVASGGWSRNKELKERRKERREKKERRKEAIERSRHQPENNVATSNNTTFSDGSSDDLSELERDHRILKKLRQGKITAKELGRDSSCSEDW